MATKNTGISRVSVASLLLSFLHVSMDVAAVPVHTYQAGSQIVIPPRVDGTCPVVNMTTENHQLFYEFCYIVDSRNETRDTAYLPGGYESAAEDFSAFEKALRNEEDVPMSDYCLQHLRPFVCFYYFPFSWPRVTAETCSKTDNITYAKPCRDFCEQTFKACETELEKMIASNNSTAGDIEHLQCHNFEEEGLCIPTPPIEKANTSCSTERDASSVSCSKSSEEANSENVGSPTSSSKKCNCANVRDSVTQRTFTHYTYSMAAHVLVISFGEEDGHVVYTVEIIKEYKISCEPLLEDNVTTVHTQQPLECRGDSAETSDCVYMEIGKDYMIVGHYGREGEWLLKDQKGTGGTVVSPWITKYEDKMDTWLKKVRPVEDSDNC